MAQQYLNQRKRHRDNRIRATLNIKNAVDERRNAIDNLTEDLTLAEIESLSPAKVRASNEMYEALKEAIEYFKRLSDEGHYPEFMLSENGGHGYSKLKDALAKADGGK